MVSGWLSQLQAVSTYGLTLPLVITETNFVSAPQPTPETVNSDAQASGAYLADLFTYLYDHYAGSAYGSSLSQYPLRVIWYSGADDINKGPPPHQQQPYIGLYDRLGNEKSVNLLYCPNDPGARYAVALDDLFAWRTMHPCF